MHVVIFAGGTLRPGKAVEAAIASADLVIAADSGAACLRMLLAQIEQMSASATLKQR